MTIDQILGDLQKKHGKEAIMALDSKPLEVETISTGSLAFDLASGIGGFPRGRIIEVYGPESTAKTTLAIHHAVEVQKAGFLVGYVDVEHAFDRQYARALGLDDSKTLFAQPNSGEDALNLVEDLLKTKSLGLIVIDSVAALTPQAEITGEMGDSKMGLHARLMSQAMRKLTGPAESSKCTLIFINQLRMKLGVMFGCFSYDTRIVLADGTTEKIGKIVTNKLPLLVRSKDENGNVVNKPIINWFNNGPTESWLKFVVDKGCGNGRSQFKVTPNHKIFTPNGEISASDLKVGDFVLRHEKWILNDDQKQIVLGSLLGDGHSKKSKRWYDNLSGDSAPSLAIHHGPKQKEYCRWKHFLFGENAKDFNEDSASFYTKPLPDLRQITRQEIVNQLDLRGVAIMYMDDGTYAARPSSQGDQCSIAKKWPLADLKHLHDKIFDLTGARGSISEKGGRITYSSNQRRIFLNAICQYSCPSMYYKWGTKNTFEFVPYNWNLNAEVRDVVGKGVIRSVESVRVKNRSQKFKYDLQIADTECYCVDGVFVHNSPETTSGGEALKYYASMRIDMRRNGQATKDKAGIGVGQGIKATFKKNKLAPPGTTCETLVVFGEGIDKCAELVDLGEQFAILERKGSWYAYQGGNLAQGKEGMRTFFKENPDFADLIAIAIKDKLLKK